MQTAGRMIIFDDGRGQLGPMTDLRASFEVRTGVLTTAQRLQAARPKTLAAYWVPEPKADLVAERADAPVNELPGDEIILCVNGRWSVPDEARLDLAVGHALIEASTGHVVAARLSRAHAEYFLATGELHERTHPDMLTDRVLYKHPWDVIGMMKSTIPYDQGLVPIAKQGAWSEGVVVIGGDIELHRDATVFPGVILDASAGTITIDAGATVRPGAVLCGPCAIGRDATVNDRAHIKANTVIGPACKVGGEIGGTIFQGYANKGHEGHLGDSWVGNWANLGAGTTNSNLLNTYGDVTMRIDPDGPRHRTGLTFLGAIIGDHVKTAILTRIMTGSVFGTGAMVATTAAPPTAVRAFTWLTDGGVRPYRLDKFEAVMRTVMARRDRDPGPAYMASLRELHDIMSPENGGGAS